MEAGAGLRKFWQLKRLKAAIIFFISTIAQMIMCNVQPCSDNPTENYHLSAVLSARQRLWTSFSASFLVSKQGNVLIVWVSLLFSIKISSHSQQLFSKREGEKKASSHKDNVFYLKSQIFPSGFQGRIHQSTKCHKWILDLDASDRQKHNPKMDANVTLCWLNV